MFNKLLLKMSYRMICFFLIFSVAFIANAYSDINNVNKTLTIKVLDTNQKPLENMVVYVEPVGHKLPFKKINTLEIGQQNKSFIPYISVMQLGSNVKFNNKDNITHHIYSPIGENKFSVKVRSGQHVIKSDFKKTAEVSMGCNIHDWMSGYLLIVDTPLFAKSDKGGNTKINIDKSGQYKIVVWHPQMKEADNRVSKLVNVDQTMKVVMQLSKPMEDIPSQKSADDFDFLSDY